ncbi:MAG: chemotaxis protein CheD [Evtepia sp.]
MSQVIIGISDQNVAKDGDILITYALGSCIGICLYDDLAKVAGLSHIMLPTHIGFDASGTQAYKFADTAIVRLIQRMQLLGAHVYRMRAKIAGGAQMFPGINNSFLSHIGQRNIDAVKSELRRLNIPIIAEDTGKTYGRTQLLYSADGRMLIRSVNQEEKFY